MPRIENARAVYEFADLFRKRCLRTGHSLLWPTYEVWNVENIATLWAAFIDNPDEGSRSFLEKWHDQLAGLPVDIHRIAADVLALYYLFPSNVRKSKKLKQVRHVVGWKLANAEPDLRLLEAAFEQGVGSAGIHYLVALPWQVAFYIEFARSILSGMGSPDNPEACSELADTISARVPHCREARNILLHLFFPDHFERIASQSHKRQIVLAFHDLCGTNTSDTATDLDQQIRNIRRLLTATLGREGWDFYDKDIVQRWRVAKSAVRSRTQRAGRELRAKRVAPSSQEPTLSPSASVPNREAESSEESHTSETSPHNTDILIEEGEQAEPQFEEPVGEERRIFAKPSDPTVKDLYDRYKEGDLLLQPDFQRYFVWDNQKSSRLIESALLEVPLPIIYFAEEPDGRESVIDGQQRLTSFFKFIDSEITLTGLQVRRDLNGKQYQEMDRTLQSKLRRTALRTITIQKESDKDLRFEIFERLNTGSVALNDQELRNCIYRGPYNVLLRRLASNPDFMSLLGLVRPEKRMRDVDLVLRFSAFHHASYLKYRSPMRRFLNTDMEDYQRIRDNDAADLEGAFKNSVHTIRSLLGKNAFKRYYRGTEQNPNGHWEPKKFNASLYDILMYGFTLYDKNQIYPHLDSVREALIYLMTEDQDFIESIELSTSALRMVTTRFDKWRQALHQVVGTPRTEPRCFSRKVKQELFDNDSTCLICGQAVNEIDDAAVDHIEQYWLGGRTIPTNARLAHRYCNWSRSRTERA